MPHINKLWRLHPGVRTGGELLFRERAADKLKHWFGTWTLLGGIGLFIATWMLIQAFASHRWDPYPFILLNLMLSCLAAVQGVILQIAANRGDRISAEVALHTHENTENLLGLEDEILSLQRRQMEILDAVKSITGVNHEALQPSPSPAHYGQAETGASHNGKCAAERDSI